MDDEALQLTQQLLSSNPDFATFWNYRREVLMHMETVKSVMVNRPFLVSFKTSEKSVGERSSLPSPGTRTTCRRCTRPSCPFWSPV